MNPCFVILFVVFSLAMLSGCNPIGKPPSGNLLVLKDPSANLGSVYPKEELHLNVKLENSSDKTIEITKIGKSCHCTSIDISNNVLLPGEQIVVPIIILAPAHAGEFEVKVDFNSNLDSRPLIFKIVGNVNRIFKSETDFCDFGNLKKGDTPVYPIKLQALAGNINKNSVFIEATEGIHWDIKWLDQENCVATIRVHPENLPGGIFKGKINFYTHDTIKKKRCVLSIPVKAMIASELSIFPSTIYFGALKQGFETSFSINIQTSTPSNLVNYTAEVSSKIIDIQSLETIKDGKKLDLRIVAEGKPEPKYEYIDLKDPKTFKTIHRIPVIGLITE